MQRIAFPVLVTLVLGFLAAPGAAQENIRHARSTSS